MNPAGPAHCEACGRPLDGTAIEGFCPACFATAVLAGAESEAPESTARTAPRRIGGYELLDELGRGGMGVVYRARQPGLQREVALKVMLDGPFASNRTAAAFRREAESAAALRHANIVTIHEVGEADGHAYYSMELVEGETLADLTRAGPLEPRRAAGYLLLVGRAIAAAHAQGVLHRDLKPGNIIVDRDDQPRVTDFGLARRLDDPADPHRTLLLGGSPGYLAPEQADPAFGPVGVAVDVYSLGATFYHALTGRPPFAAATIAATLDQVLRDEPAPPRKLNSQVPRDLETICLKCLQKKPAQRYASATALAEDLAAFLEHRPIRARPVSAAERTWLWLRRRPALAGLGAALLLAVGIGAGALLWQWRVMRANLYSADLRVAAEAIDLGDLGRARELLALHEPRADEADFTWRLLHQLAAGDPRRVLGEHPWIVGAIAWSADGERIASASVGSGTVDADIRIWNPNSQDATPLILSTNGARELAWFPGHTRLLAAHYDGRVRVWNVERRKVEREFAGRSASLSADGQVLAVCEGDPFAWNTGSTNGVVTLHDLDSGTTRTFEAARYVALSPGGRWLATTDFVAPIHLHDLKNDRRHELPCELMLWALSFSPDESRLIATGFGEAPLLWRLDAPEQPPVRLRGHRLNTWRAAFSPDNKRVVTASSDQSLRLWDADSGPAVSMLRGHASEVWCAAFSPDGKHLASGGKDRAVMLWDTRFNRPETDFASPEWAEALFSEDGRTLAIPTPGGRSEWRLVETISGAVRASVRPSGRPLALRADGTWIAIAEGWRVERRRGADQPAPGAFMELAHDPAEPPPRWWVADPAGQIAVGLTATGVFSVWDLHEGRRLRRWRTPATGGNLRLSPDRRRVVATAGEDGFWLCDLATGKTTRLTAHRDQGKAAAFSADSRQLATASVDGTVKLWDVRSARELFTFRGHRTGVSGVAFAPDGVTLASSEQGVGLRFWHLPTRREIAVVNQPDAGEWIEFAPDGSALALQLVGGGIRLLRAL